MTMLEEPPITEAIQAPLFKQEYPPVGYHMIGDPPLPPVITFAKMQALLAAGFVEVPTRPRFPRIAPGPEPTNEQIANTLERTRKIVKAGWTQWKFHRRGKRCVLGALHYAIFGTDVVDYTTATGAQVRLHRACVKAIAKAIGATESLTVTQIASWNDRSERTKREVMRMLRTRARELR